MTALRHCIIRAFVLLSTTAGLLCAPGGAPPASAQTRDECAARIASTQTDIKESEKAIRAAQNLLSISADGENFFLGTARGTTRQITRLRTLTKNAVSVTKLRTALAELRGAADVGLVRDVADDAEATLFVLDSASAAVVLRGLIANGELTSLEGGRVLAALAAGTGQDRADIKRRKAEFDDRLNSARLELKQAQADCRTICAVQFQSVVLAQIGSCGTASTSRPSTPATIPATTAPARGVLVLETIRPTVDPANIWQGSGKSFSRTIQFGTQTLDFPIPDRIGPEGVTFTITATALASVSNLATECEVRTGYFTATATPNAHFSAFSPMPGQSDTKTVVVTLKPPSSLTVGSTMEVSFGCFSGLNVAYVFRVR